MRFLILAVDDHATLVVSVLEAKLAAMQTAWWAKARESVAKSACSEVIDQTHFQEASDPARK
jgi:hypothetical protein